MLPHVLIGGVAGTAARWYLQRLIQHGSGTSFPVGTLTVNLTGCMLIGLVARWGAESPALSEAVRVGVTVGFCGAFTTMSAFGYETVGLLHAQQYGRAALYLGLTIGGSIAAVLAGAWLAGRLMQG